MGMYTGLSKFHSLVCSLPSSMQLFAQLQVLPNESEQLISRTPNQNKNIKLATSFGRFFFNTDSVYIFACVPMP
jgi:hypothetical protein